MKMASTRCIISFLLMFILLHVTNSTALITHQGMEKTVAARDEVLGPLAIADTEVSNTRLGGRKMMMMLKKVLRKEMTVEVLDTESTKIGSGAAHHDTVGNCNKGSVSNGKCNNNRINSHPSKDKMVGFTTFSADYRVPKSHPPKNNR